jgi:hypothetical protein
MIKIELVKHEANFVPAERIAGMVSWSEAEGTSLEVRLIWYTVGKGDRDFGLVATHQVSSFESSGKEDFEFAAPTRPQSFSGKHISLQWAIEAIIFPSQTSQRADLTISNNGKEIVLGSLSESEL